MTGGRAPRIGMVCFDAGGVLVRICRSWEEGCRAAGLEVRRSERADAGEPERQAINAAYQRGEIACDEFFERVAETTAGLYSPGDILAIHDAWILGEYQGVGRLIGGLNRLQGVATGLLSNTSTRHWESALMAGGRGVSAVGSIEHQHASHLLGLLKPDGAIYRAFERETGAAGGEILFFDDLEENIAAARAAGWAAEHIDHTGDTAAQIESALRRHGVVET